MTHTAKRIIVAVTGASGTIYARQLIRRLVDSKQVEDIALIVSRNGEAVALHEGEQFESCSKIQRLAPDDMFASVASGSAHWDAMVVVPCSMGTLGRIACGVSMDLIGRAADVMLKERRTLILVPRETPLSLVHLRNMVCVTECGAIILPATPSFYSIATDIESLCESVTERIISLLDVDSPHFEWGK